MIKQLRWIEAWIESNDYQYVLLLRHFEDGSYELMDPQEKHVIVEVFQSYDEAIDWLVSDEYWRIGKYSFED